jgi:hypothetical protein
MSEVVNSTTRIAQPDLTAVVASWSGPLNHIAMHIPCSPPLFQASRLWDIWSDYFHEYFRLPKYHSRQHQLDHCAKATRRYFASREQWVDRNSEHMYLLRLPEYLAFSLNVKFDGLEEALNSWVDLGANINVVDDTGMTPLLHMQSSSARDMWRYIRLLIEYGANQHATDTLQGIGPLQLALVWLRIHDTSGNLGARRWCYLVEMEKRLIVLLEAGCYGNATDLWGNAPPESKQGDELYWVVWKRALTRVEHRKSLNPVDRDADLRSRKPSRPSQYMQLYSFWTSASALNNIVHCYLPSSLSH